MFSINVRGKENPKSLEQVKLELVFFKTGYPRVTKIINIRFDDSNTSVIIRLNLDDCISRQRLFPESQS
ncbi:MAG: hypothetical protein SNG27_06540 [Rikenellaceae bacterium]